MSLLLDTCVVTECLKPRPEPEVQSWLDRHDSPGTFLSVLVIGEIRQGISRIAGTPKAQSLADWLEQVLLPRFDRRVLPVNEAVAQRWGELRGQAMARGRTPPVIDSLLAATALEHRLALATRNTRDFQALGVEVVNPWAVPP
ncbi:MAG: type II toxin-antitoxin system VapC family toxin [Xanthomonadaceae bacterium]|nr:type II toxin-antitoxin system VapC family toxin [Xanthomonadaceae bacterium]